MLPDFSGCELVLRDVSGYCRMSGAKGVNGCCRVLLGVSGCHLVSLGVSSPPGSIGVSGPAGASGGERAPRALLDVNGNSEW